MVALWCVFGLIIAAGAVSALGAAFSVEGLSALFSGAALAVCLMAGSLEFAKFVLAAYLHQRWGKLNPLFKGYLLSSIVVLSLITSMGIFGFLSNAYQSASSQLEAENIKADSLKIQKSRHQSEIDRLNRSVDEIPDSRISKHLKLRADLGPTLNDLNRKVGQVDELIAQSNLRALEIKQKVGPLIYIARAFKMEIDDVVKYLILLFVCVFDPLAICLVIATSDAFNSRKEKSTESPVAAPAVAAGAPPMPSEDVIQMRFADPPPDQKTG